jgi:thiosulfate reductase cytochrome b subunit
VADSGARPDAVRVVHKHHALVRFAHWVNAPLLLGLIVSGLSIYWAAPVLRHAPDPATGSRDYLVDLGALAARALGVRGPRASMWFYDHLSLGPYQLAAALRLHWAMAYLFMANGTVYLIGLALGGGWRALLPRPADGSGAWAMVRYYAGLVPSALRGRPWPHPPVRSKYNALQRAAYFTVVAAGGLAVLSGWAMHKPVQLGWLERLFGSYDGARLVHFLCMLVLAGFVVPHAGLAIADGWDTLRSMVVGWSARVKEEPREGGAA